MRLPHPLTSLRTVLLIDAVICIAFGVLLAAAAGPISGPLGIPETFLVYVGAALVPIGLFMVATGMSAHLRESACVHLIIAGNVVYVLASLVLPFAGWFEPEPLGTLFIIAQALGVVPLIVLELHAARLDSRRRYA